MKYAFIKALTFAAILAISVPATAVEFAASPNPVGSGARATGMGGAFIAVADDATAASWNPAGLVQLERPEFSVVGAFGYRSEDVSSASQPLANGGNATPAAGLNYISAAYPFTIANHNIVVSANYQRLYDMDKDLHVRINRVAGPFSFDERIGYIQRGGLSTLSPAFAVQITPALSFGFTANFWTDPINGNGWISDNYERADVSLFGLPFSTDFIHSHDRNDFQGFNFNAGLLYSPTSSLTIAAVYKDGFIGRLRRDRETYNSALIPVRTSDRSYQRLTMPRSYGVGLSYRFSDALTVAADAYRTEWGEFIMNDNGVQTRPTLLKAQSKTKMSGTTQARVGAEYLIIKPSYTVPLRAGAFYDPEPSENAPNDFYGVSAGTGISYGPVAFDISYSFRMGRSGESVGTSATDSRITQHTALFSVIYHL